MTIDPMTIDVRLGIDTPAPETLAVGLTSSGLLLDGVPTQVLPVAARSLLETFVAERDPSAKPGDVRDVPLPGALPARVLLAGLGPSEPGSSESGSSGLGPSEPRPSVLGSVEPGDLRLAGAAIARAAGGDVGVAIPVSGAQLAALAEGLLLGGYRFDTRPRRAPLPRAWLLGAGEDAGNSASTNAEFTEDVAFARGVAYAQGAILARELANTRAWTKTPTWVARAATETLTPLGVRVATRDAAWLAAQGFGGILAVGGGAAAPPCLVEARWRPRGAATHLVVVGKGITYDTGGYNLKPGASMTGMHTDVSGGAAALGALRVIAALRVPVAVTVLVPLAENAVSGSAMRPGDVIRHYGGRTTEVLNTDAEGRLVLADALAYAARRLRPDALVDIATLTGGIKVALGVQTAGVFTTSDELARDLSQAGQRTGEPLWRMPLPDDYAGLLASQVADANNSPGNPQSITAALFLRPFAGETPWAHLDIAGTARSDADRGVASRGATGFGARLLARWIASHTLD